MRFLSIFFLVSFTVSSAMAQQPGSVSTIAEPSTTGADKAETVAEQPATASGVTAETVRSIVYSKDGKFSGRLYQASDTQWVDLTLNGGDVPFNVTSRAGHVLSLTRHGAKVKLEIDLQSKKITFAGKPFYEVQSASAAPYVPRKEELRRIYFGPSVEEQFIGEFRLANGTWKRNGRSPISKADFKVESHTDTKLTLISESGEKVAIDFSARTITGNDASYKIIVAGHTPRTPSEPYTGDPKLLGTWQRKSTAMGARVEVVPSDEKDLTTFEIDGTFSWVTDHDRRDGTFKLNGDKLETAGVQKQIFKVVSCDSDILKLEVSEDGNTFTTTFARASSSQSK